MQVLFQSSAESESSLPGLGVIPARISSFSNATKSVPHMGWNSTHLIDPSSKSASGVSDGAHYYFVHTFRAAYEPETNPEGAEWAHSVTQYGQEIFMASVRKGNVFGCQFHPEKSGEAGLRMLDAWLREPESSRAHAPPTPRIPWPPREKDGLTKRIIACMDVRANDQGDLVVTKGDQYDVREKAPEPTSTSTPTSTESNTVAAHTGGAVRNLGKPVALASRYFASGADELALLNITSFRHSPLLDQPMIAVVRAAAQAVFVPLTIGGGIRDTVDPDGTPHTALEVAGAYFRAGADKVSIGSEAVYAVEKMLANGGKGDGKSGIETISWAYGRQAVVVSIDPRKVYVDPETYDGPYKSELILASSARSKDLSKDASTNPKKAWWYQCTVSGGRESRPLSVVQLAQGVEQLGAGEILLNSIDRDGTGAGFDHDLIGLVRKAVTIPVVASSGAGKAEHFVEVFEETGVESALAAGIFHREEVGIQEVKEALRKAGIEVRGL